MYRLVTSTEVTKLVMKPRAVGPEVNNQLIVTEVEVTNLLSL